MSISQKDNKEIVLENHLSTEQKWLLEITSTHFGINQRIKNLLIKIHDTPRKPKLIHDGLREISLSDMWFYKAHQESEKAFQTILTLFNKLLNIEGLDKQDKWLFLNTLIEFILEIIQNDGIGIDTLVAEILTILENSLLDDPEIRIYASSLLKRLPAQFAKGRDYLHRMEDLLKGALSENISMWRKQLNFEYWSKSHDEHFFKKHKNDILTISNKEKQLIEEVEERLSQANSWEELETIAGFKELLNGLISLMEKDTPVLENIYFLYYLLETRAMTGLRDTLLIELAHLYTRFTPDALKALSLDNFLNNTFFLFESIKTENIEKILECLLKLGQKIYETEEQQYIDTFIDYIIRFGFIYPSEIKIDDELQVQTDNSHLKMIRLWLHLIKCSPRRSSRLIAALIVNLREGGILIHDNDLFQRDISQLLNSNIKPSYILIKQLLNLFPVYFDTIGAEGKIREISTEIDKLTFGEDKLIHFLRKQVHTESNNTQIELIRRIFCFWYNKNHKPLSEYLPQDVQRELTVSGKWFTQVHNIANELRRLLRVPPEAILEEDIDEIKRALTLINNIEDSGSRRVIYLIELYQLHIIF
jgi:pyruvate,orthophosphate dikinase